MQRGNRVKVFTLNSNITALNTIRLLNQNQALENQITERLSSGLRINRASDDAAGLAIAATLNADVRVLNRAVLNINDGISLLNIADGAFNVITQILTRGAELAEQAANGVYNATQKQPLQDEMNALLAEIDRISETTHFNQLKLLAGRDPRAADKFAIIQGLKSSWLQQSEQLIAAHFGLSGDGATLRVVLEDSIPQYLASVSGQVAFDGKIINQQLNIDISDFIPATLPNGGTSPYYNDRIIAHEMVHAIMGRTMNFAALPEWFSEGAAEFIHGADERLLVDIILNGGQGSGGEDAVANEIDLHWTGSSLQYSTGYAAVRYLHDRIKNAGGNGIIDIMTYLSTNQNDDLDDALTNIANGSYAGGLSGANSFYEDFKTNGNGSLYIQSMNLANADTGAIGGFDADGGPVRNAEDVIPDTINFLEDPLTGFVTIFPEINMDSGQIVFAVGKKGSDTLEIILTSASTDSLNLNNIDIINNAGTALDKFKDALHLIAAERGKIGGVHSRFEAAQNNLRVMAENLKSAESRIMDADVAEEAAKLVSAQIRKRAATAILAQANANQQQVLSLIGT